MSFRRAHVMCRLDPPDHFFLYGVVRYFDALLRTSEDP
jgi:hypothetical protein